MNTWHAALLLLCHAACHGCASSGGEPSPASGVTLGSLTVTSTSFPAGGAIPVDNTCDGADRSPELTWSVPPVGTQSFAIVTDDSDAPGGSFVHWVVYDLRGDVHELGEGADASQAGFSVGMSDFHRPGYAGPCPPRQELHHYSFHVYALDSSIRVPPGATRSAVLEAMSGHVLAHGVLVGTFWH